MTRNVGLESEEKERRNKYKTENKNWDGVVIPDKRREVGWRGGGKRMEKRKRRGRECM